MRYLLFFLLLIPTVTGKVRVERIWHIPLASNKRDVKASMYLFHNEILPYYEDSVTYLYFPGNQSDNYYFFDFDKNDSLYSLGYVYTKLSPQQISDTFQSLVSKSVSLYGKALTQLITVRKGINDLQEVYDDVLHNNAQVTLAWEFMDPAEEKWAYTLNIIKADSEVHVSEGAQKE